MHLADDLLKSFYATYTHPVNKQLWYISTVALGLALLWWGLGVTTMSVPPIVENSRIYENVTEENPQYSNADFFVPPLGKNTQGYIWNEK